MNNLFHPFSLKHSHYKRKNVPIYTQNVYKSFTIRNKQVKLQVWPNLRAPFSDELELLSYRSILVCGFGYMTSWQVCVFIFVPSYLFEFSR